VKNTIRLALLTLAALVGTDAMHATAIVGGNPVISQPNVDTFQNFAVLDKNNPISGTGDLMQWQIYAGAVEPVELLIYASTGPNTYAVIGSSVSEIPVLGLNTFTLSTPIAVQAGDFVGLFFSNTGSVDFAPLVGNLGNLSGSLLFTGDNSGSTTNFVNSTTRTYSVDVSGITTPEPSNLALAAAALLALAWAARNRK
jgi:hypothetical protein